MGVTLNQQVTPNARPKNRTQVPARPGSRPPLFRHGPHDMALGRRRHISATYSAWNRRRNQMVRRRPGSLGGFPRRPKGRLTVAATESARGLAGHSGAGTHSRALHANCTPSRRRPPAYARDYQPGPNGLAVVCCGWPAAKPAPHVLVLPPDLRPADVGWDLLRGACVFVTPPPGCRTSADLLRELGRELAAAGARAVVLYDGARVLADWWRCAGERPEVRP